MDTVSHDGTVTPAVWNGLDWRMYVRCQRRAGTRNQFCSKHRAVAAGGGGVVGGLL